MRSPLAALLLLAGALPAGAQTSFTVTAASTSNYTIDGDADPTLTLIRGSTYQFVVNTPGHPFYIKTARIAGTGSRFDDGVTGQGTTSGTLTFVVPLNAPNPLHYQCSNHSAMGGTLTITDPVSVPADGVPRAAWLGPAVPNPASRGATFRFGIPRDGRVEFALFDLSGRTVRVLARAERTAGVHTLRWDGRDAAGRAVPSGRYAFRLRLEGRELHGSLLVAR
jgi:hypothetical protein